MSQSKSFFKDRSFQKFPQKDLSLKSLLILSDEYFRIFQTLSVPSKIFRGASGFTLTDRGISKKAWKIRRNFERTQKFWKISAQHRCKSKLSQHEIGIAWNKLLAQMQVGRGLKQLYSTQPASKTGSNCELINSSVNFIRINCITAAV